MKRLKPTRPSPNRFGCYCIRKWFGPAVVLAYLFGLWTSNIHQNSPPGPGNGPENVPRGTQARSVSKLDSITSSNPAFPREPSPRPPLNTIIQGWNVTGDPSWLLNLAIVGFPKTGTSTLMKYLDMAPQVMVFDEERCEMGWNQHVRLMDSLYNDMPPGDFIRGIKCPRDLETPLAMKNYAKFFPKTDFMVGLRHPIEWFESFYNFRVNNYFTMPPADALLGRCTRRKQGLCSYRGNFQLFLANMGKTNIQNDPEEQALVPEEFRKFIQPIPLKGRVFLWEMSQLKPDIFQQSSNVSATSIGSEMQGQLRHSEAQFRKDLQHFLYLEKPLPEMIWVKPGYAHKNATILDHVTSQKIDICDVRYEELRSVLLQQGILAAQWIRRYFLEAEGIVVSQKEYFTNVILKRWEQDPCWDRVAGTPS